MCPSSDFKWKTKFTIVILTKNGFQKFHTFYSKLLSKIWIFIWNLLRGTWKGFSFDVYMPFITIFIKIKQPFAWHIYFLVRHLRRYSVACNYTLYNVDIEQGIYKVKLKVALNEKRKKLHEFSFSINMANFEAFL